MIQTNPLTKAQVLATLYNASRPLGMGFLHYTPEPMSDKEAQEILNTGQDYFDYLKGRVMKISLKEDGQFEGGLYDRDNGAGAAQRAVSAAIAKGENAPEIREAHVTGTSAAAQRIQSILNTPSTQSADGSVIHLDLADVADVLKPRINKFLPPKEKISSGDEPSIIKLACA